MRDPDEEERRRAVEPPAMVHIVEDGQNRMVPLLDVDKILKERIQTVGILLSDGIALEMKNLPMRDFVLVRHKHKDYIEGERENLKRCNMLLDKSKHEELTAEEHEFCKLFEARGFDYNSEVYWHMVHRPKMSLEKWRLLLCELDADDQAKIYNYCREKLQQHYLDPKN